MGLPSDVGYSISGTEAVEGTMDMGGASQENRTPRIRLHGTNTSTSVLNSTWLSFTSFCVFPV